MRVHVACLHTRVYNNDESISIPRGNSSVPLESHPPFSFHFARVEPEKESPRRCWGALCTYLEMNQVPRHPKARQVLITYLKNLSCRASLSLLPATHVSHPPSTYIQHVPETSLGPRVIPNKRNEKVEKNFAFTILLHYYTLTGMTPAAIIFDCLSAHLHWTLNVERVQEEVWWTGGCRWVLYFCQFLSYYFQIGLFWPESFNGKRWYIWWLAIWGGNKGWF